MKAHAIVLGIMMGSALLALGLIPGLFRSLTEGLHNALNSIEPRPRRYPDLAHLERPIGIATAGLAIIALSLVAYLSN